MRRNITAKAQVPHAVSDSDMSNRASNVLINNGYITAKSVHKAFDGQHKELLQLQNCGGRTMNEIVDYYALKGAP
ncbi:MAG: hypothetical protein DRR42_09925 [Gammaproteobacteria bacterium]|nr:MAG: hypothetical protein DRR42_09925 [Gammaproteobacteria bacterium]